MFAAQLTGPDQLDIVELPIPSIGEGEVLVRMETASICGSDLHVLHGPFQPEFPAQPGYPGHEGIGTVVESRTPAFAPGELVLTVPWLGRMTCFAEYHVGEAGSLVKLPDGVDPQWLLMAQQLGTTIFAMKSFLPGVERRSAAVLGAGSAGLFFVHHLKRVGFETVILAEPLADRRRTATKLGADHVVDPFETSPGDLARELTNGIGCDLVIEAAGTREARRDAIDAVAARGRVGLFGYAEAPGEEPFPFADTWRKALTLVASANTQLEPGLASFKEAVDLIATKVVPVDHLLEDDVFPLSDVQQAFTTAQERRSNKVRVGLA